ncbi:MAG TPA: type II toxin-antitoxin system RelE/ParE family toxin [Candidatus Thermoplasmatota archaeon]|nr:type II toxin-antitoxin system RelE/ParE family toxin [Candidatus Thermoplasmatota archaeon]
MTFAVEFTASASKEFRQLPPDIQRRLEAAIDALAVAWPRVRPSQAKRLVGSEAWRLRVGAYRGIFQSVDGMLVFTRFGLRSTVYRA